MIRPITMIKHEIAHSHVLDWVPLWSKSYADGHTHSQLVAKCDCGRYTKFSHTAERISSNYKRRAGIVVQPGESVEFKVEIDNG